MEGVFLSEFYTLQLDYLLRLLIAALCGLAIGFERELKMKSYCTEKQNGWLLLKLKY